MGALGGLTLNSGCLLFPCQVTHGSCLSEVRQTTECYNHPPLLSGQNEKVMHTVITNSLLYWDFSAE